MMASIFHQKFIQVFALIGLCLVCSLETGFAQSPTRANIQRETAVNSERRLPARPLNAGKEQKIKATEVEEDFLGLQQVLIAPEVFHPFRVWANAGVDFTDNVALVPRGLLDDAYFFSTLGLDYTLPLSNFLFGRAGIYQSNYRYDEFDILDFDYVNMHAGLIFGYPVRDTYFFDPIFANSAFTLDYAYYNILESGYGDTIFDNHSIIVRWDKSVPINRTQRLLLGLSADLSIAADRDDTRRHEFAALLGYEIVWSPKLRTSIVYRPGYYDYFEFGRGDWNHVASMTAAAQLTDWMVLVASVGFTGNQSNLDVFDYDRWDVGGQIGLQIQFGGERPVIPDFSTRSGK